MGLIGLLKSAAVKPAPAEPHSFLARVGEGGARFRNVVFTNNRRVMISVGDRGETLRVHERFREAPAAVQRAVGMLYGGRGRQREEAREVIRAFLQDLPSEPGRRPARRVLPGDAPIIERLRFEFDHVNEVFFDEALPSVPILLSGRMRRRNGHFSANPLEIVISRRLVTHAVPGEAEKTLRHEMIHLWQHQEGRRVGHGSDFRRWAERLAIHPRASRVVRLHERVPSG